jgi:hypothetical protein
VLLPLADEVLLGTEAKPWDEVLAHLTPEPDLDPPRWRGEEWPS